MKNILFVCKYNRFRSKVANAYFKQLNKNKNINSDSAGIFPGSYPLDGVQYKITKKLGVNISGRPKGINLKLLKEQDIIVIVADNVPPSLFKSNKNYKRKLIIWKIKDESFGREKNIKKIVFQIKGKVEKFIKQLEKEGRK